MMDRVTTKRLVALVATAAILAAVSTPGLASHETSEDGLPADRVSTAAAELEVMTSKVSDGSVSENVTILHTQMRTSEPTDLILSVTAECALWTQVTTVGNDEQEAVASVDVWVEVDGEPVEVVDNPEVVFCDRAHRVTTTNWDDEDATTERFERTRTANGFNWIEKNLGKGVHDLVVKAHLEGQASGNAEAKAAIGARTLVAEPTFLDEGQTG